jgi:cell division protein FtsQ
MSSDIVNEPVSPVDRDLALASAIGLVSALAVLIVIFFMVQLVLDHFRNPGRFPIKSVVVEGYYQHTDHNQLRDRVMGQAQRGFFNLDIAEIQQDVEELPWVEKAYVRRIWPESISVHIEEHQPVARWGDDGLLSDKFKLFFPPNGGRVENPAQQIVIDQLPQLSAPDRRHAALLKLLKTTEPLLARIEAPLVGISEDERRSVTLTMKGDVQVVIGHRLIEERIERFAEIFRPYIAPVYDDVSRVDMRYTNGFALARKSAVNNTSRLD